MAWSQRLPARANRANAGSRSRSSCLTQRSSDLRAARPRAVRSGSDRNQSAAAAASRWSPRFCCASRNRRRRVAASIGDISETISSTYRQFFRRIRSSCSCTLGAWPRLQQVLGPGATSAARVATRRSSVIPARRPRLPRHGPRATNSTAARFDGLASRRTSRLTACCRAAASSRSHGPPCRGGCAARTSSSRISASRPATRSSAARNPRACSVEKNDLNDLSNARRRRQSTRHWWTSCSLASRRRERRT